MRTTVIVRSLVAILALASLSLVACSGGAMGDSAAAGAVAQGDVPGHGQGPSAMPQSASGTFGNGASAAALSTTSGATFELAHYAVSQRPDHDPDQVDLVDCSGKLLTKASTAWKAEAELLGTARFVGADGLAHTIESGSGCWVTLPESLPWGLGVDDPKTKMAFALSPFRSIAIDPSVLTLGAWYYLEELDGVTLPAPAEGQVHDGCVRAVDVRPAIKGHRIDLFTGLDSASMTGKESVTVYPGDSKCAAHVASDTGEHAPPGR